MPAFQPHCGSDSHCEFRSDLSLIAKLKITFSSKYFFQWSQHKDIAYKRLISSTAEVISSFYSEDFTPSSYIDHRPPGTRAVSSFFALIT
ncbi:hypothetical protein O181_021617 [Austropuccinia psidii MF-1]|uniref:Uncharacterized protein n=1 Tax=Austropuccinia psidii MF-1 TaxID=1389203 RepID=A0A9Q3GWE6_9BASI|nr:hypothetical protein [Austropuccinia psidii MF-1]